MAVAQSKLAGKGITLADVKGISAGFNEAISPIESVMPIIEAPQTGRIIPEGAPTDKGQPLGYGGVTINVNSQLATKAEIGEAVNNALIAYNRLSGPLELKIA
jgi:hypothetical protein